MFFRWVYPIHCELDIQEDRIFSDTFHENARQVIETFNYEMLYIFILQTYFSNIYVYVYVEQIVQTNRIHQLIQFLTRSSSVNIERQMTRNTPDYGWFRTSPITKQYFIGYNNHKVREWWSNSIKLISTSATRKKPIIRESFISESIEDFRFDSSKNTIDFDFVTIMTILSHENMTWMTSAKPSYSLIWQSSKRKWKTSIRFRIFYIDYTLFVTRKWWMWILPDTDDTYRWLCLNGYKLDNMTP